MKAELKQKWIEALRSGSYKQTIGLLRDDARGHCCLGVLCDIVEPTGWYEDRDVEEDRHNIASENELGPSGRRAVGLTSIEEMTLIKKNDAGQSFAEIADWIEVNVPAETSQS